MIQRASLVERGELDNERAREQHRLIAERFDTAIAALKSEDGLQEDLSEVFGAARRFFEAESAHLPSSLTSTAGVIELACSVSDVDPNFLGLKADDLRVAVDSAENLARAAELLKLALARGLIT